MSKLLKIKGLEGTYHIPLDNILGLQSSQPFKDERTYYYVLFKDQVRVVEVNEQEYNQVKFLLENQ